MAMASTISLRSEIAKVFSFGPAGKMAPSKMSLYLVSSNQSKEPRLSPRAMLMATATSTCLSGSIFPLIKAARCPLPGSMPMMAYRPFF
jgi:hypothetical protein